jgi:hypothetical protein
MLPLDTLPEVASASSHREGDLFSLGGGQLEFSARYELPDGMIQSAPGIVECLTERKAETIRECGHVADGDDEMPDNSTVVRQLSVGLNMSVDGIGFWFESDTEFLVEFSELGLSSLYFGTRSFEDDHV